MNNANEQHTTSGAVKIQYQRQKKVLSSSEPTFPKSENKQGSRAMVHAFTLHAQSKGAIKVPSAPIPANNAVTTVIEQ